MVSILQILREADKQYSRKDVSNTKPAPRRRQTTADLDPYNYVYSLNRLLNYLFDECKKKVEFLAAT
jgi:hypothetical protein